MVIYQYPARQHVVIVVYELGPVQHELADQVNGGLAHRSALVQEGAVDPGRHVGPAQHGGVHLHYHGQALHCARADGDGVFTQDQQDLQLCKYYCNSIIL